MAVYTKISSKDIHLINSKFDIDEIKNFNGIKKGIENNRDDLDLKLRLIAMQISSGLISDAKLSLSKMQYHDKSILKKLIDIYPEVLNVKSMNQFFDFYNDNSSK